MESSEEIQVRAAKAILAMGSLGGLTTSWIDPVLSYYTRSQGREVQLRLF
jgi:hypothetical protein